MMMSYIDTATLMEDRGDGPARDVIDRNARTFAERASNETKEELAKVLERVENVSIIYKSRRQHIIKYFIFVLNILKHTLSRKQN